MKILNLLQRLIRRMASLMNKSIGNASNKDAETYQLLEQFDHILKRSETYISSTKSCQKV